MKIFKYKIEIINRRFKLVLPENFNPLAFQVQPAAMSHNGPLQLWALVDASEKTKEFTFICVGTGIDFDPGRMRYVGTAQSEGFVWHLFYE